MGKKTIVTSAIVFVTVLALLLYTVLGSGSEEQDPGASTTATTTTEAAEPVPARPACPTPTVDKVTLPCLGSDITDAEDPAALAEDHITVVNLWAWWCDPCREELPLFDELQKNHPEYTVVGVHADESAAKGAALLDELGIKMPSYQDSENKFAGVLSLPGVVPITLVVGSNGIVKSIAAQPFDSYEDLDQAVEEMSTAR